MADVNGFDPAAYSIDGAQIPSDLMRVQTYAGTGGAEGVISPGDLKVHQLAQAGPQIAIDPGAAIVRGRSAGQRNQSYVVNGRTESRLDVTPTGSDGGRSDLVIVRIEDPQFSPWEPLPEEEAPDHQYVEPTIIENVPANTQTFAQLGEDYSAYALARIDIPANTAAITDQFVKPLRQLSQPQFFPELLTSSGVPQLQQSANWENWPSFQPMIAIPEWATWISIAAELSGVLAAGSADGELRLNLGGQILGIPRAYDVNSSAGDGVRVDLNVSAAGFLTPGLAGTTQLLTVQAHKWDAAQPGYLQCDGYVHIAYDIRYFQRAV